ncbi:DUF261 family protein (plasmid) [Borrelia sp. A-FGy1]|uniref:DUF261 family protein n=1 Tax=Borrelia sp. A-FGy1 TaxID=2608247 RepID=UPI0015F49FC3|nr:DUF261 family protein [Borrelia sp. A-FGy1]QMU99663.1 DUF261 family protein [Borrelia sp. A-FGy1]
MKYKLASLYRAAYKFFYNLLKEYFIKKYRSEMLEGACRGVAEIAVECKRIVESAKHRLVLPLQHSFSDNNPVIAKYGCYFLCILFIGLVVKEIKDKVEKCFDKFEVDLLYKSFSNAGGLREQNSYVEDPDLILANLGLDEHLCYRSKHYEVSYKVEESDLVIGQYKDKESDMYHFVVLGDSLGEVVWDSLGRSRAVEVGMLSSLRVFKLLDKSLVAGVRERLAFYKNEFRGLRAELA